jgi:hypothetical protein
LQEPLSPEMQEPEEPPLEVEERLQSFGVVAEHPEG